MIRHPKYPRLLLILLCTSLIGITLFAGSHWGSVRAEGADLLRDLLGDRAVAKLEMVLFHLQDSVLHWEYDLGLVEPASPWEIISASTGVMTSSTADPIRVTASSTPSPTEITGPERRSATPTPQPTATPTNIPTPTPWALATLQPCGSLDGEGIWTPYIQDLNGKVLAYRAFLQPDPERPYVIVAVVAFDLKNTRLKFILGSEEPYNPDSPKRDGRISEEDKKPGHLLATFNGGFKATHGHFGAMASGVEALPPRDGFGTIAMYSDGRVAIGAWGKEILPSADLSAWRQNGPLVIADGQINEQIYNNNPMDWGYTVDDVSPTLRSGLAISPDGRTLYYFAGDKMTMEDLANSMKVARAANGIQLDINNYWVNFVVLRTKAGQMLVEPLLPDLMRENLDRYLYPYVRDYFYITSVP